MITAKWINKCTNQVQIGYHKNQLKAILFIYLFNIHQWRTKRQTQTLRILIESLRLFLVLRKFKPSVVGDRIPQFFPEKKSLKLILKNVERTILKFRNCTRLALYVHYTYSYSQAIFYSGSLTSFLLLSETTRQQMICSGKGSELFILDTCN